MRWTDLEAGLNLVQICVIAWLGGAPNKQLSPERQEQLKCWHALLLNGFSINQMSAVRTRPIPVADQ